MYARPLHRDWEIIRWAAIISLAVAITFAIATALGATDIPKSADKPLRMPTMGIESKPSPSDAAQRELGASLWRTFGLHTQNRYREAIHAWNEMSIPRESEVWKRLGIGQAAIAVQDFAMAEEALTTAEQLQPANPVVHYFLGVLRLVQATNANEWPDNLTKRTRFVAYPRQQIVPNTKSMYVLAATMELQKAIEYADAIDLDKLLVPSSMSRYVPLEPTVGDLLIALGAENFKGQAHHTLSSLFLENGSLEIAEEHMDNAVNSGLANVFGFRDLATAYEKRGQHADAARANLKAMAHGHNKVSPAFDVFRNLLDALFDLR